MAPRRRPTRVQRNKDSSPSQSRLVLPPTNITRRPTYMATPSKNGPEHNMENHPPHRINANTATKDRSRHAPTQAKHTETDTRRQKPIPHTSIPTAPPQAPSPSSSTPPTTPDPNHTPSTGTATPNSRHHPQTPARPRRLSPRRSAIKATIKAGGTAVPPPRGDLTTLPPQTPTRKRLSDTLTHPYQCTTLHAPPTWY